MGGLRATFTLRQRPDNGWRPASGFMEEMSVTADHECAGGERLAVYVAGVRAQLAPIRSRAALLDSYRREALNVLVPITEASDPGSVGLEIAYMLRWLELPEEQFGIAEMTVGEMI